MRPSQAAGGVPSPGSALHGQDEVIAFLSRAQSYGAPGGRVECIATHGSLVFLQGERAYKLKRAVAYAALDFRSLDSRQQACHAELRLNRRTAPQLYLQVRSINRVAGGQLAFDGPGPALDWVVVMRRFPQSALFERMALAGQLDAALMDELGMVIARFHGAAEITPAFGGASGIAEAIEDNQRELRHYLYLLDARAVQRLYDSSRSTLDALGAELERRRHEGRVRRCHGDLRLANICLFEGRPTLFDGIEFSESLACIDVLYDLAFVLMDLQHHGYPELAVRLLGSYRGHGGAGDDCLVLPLFLALRAATRSYALTCSATRQSDPLASQDKARQARALLLQAQAHLAKTSPLLRLLGQGVA